MNITLLRDTGHERIAWYFQIPKFHFQIHCFCFVLKLSVTLKAYIARWTFQTNTRCKLWKVLNFFALIQWFILFKINIFGAIVGHHCFVSTIRKSRVVKISRFGDPNLSVESRAFSCIVAFHKKKGLFRSVSVIFKRLMRQHWAYLFVELALWGKLTLRWYF